MFKFKFGNKQLTSQDLLLQVELFSPFNIKKDTKKGHKLEFKYQSPIMKKYKQAKAKTYNIIVETT